MRNNEREKETSTSDEGKIEKEQGGEKEESDAEADQGRRTRSSRTPLLSAAGAEREGERSSETRGKRGKEIRRYTAHTVSGVRRSVPSPRIPPCTCIRVAHVCACTK